MISLPKRSPAAKVKAMKDFIEDVTDIIGMDDSSSSSSSNSSDNSDREDGNNDIGTANKKNAEFRNFVWRYLGYYFPMQWCQNFDQKCFDRFRIENNRSSCSSDAGSEQRALRNEVPFLSSEDCQGPVRRMCCLSNNKNDFIRESGDHEERFNRSEICKECYWFMSAINTVMEGGEYIVDDESDSSSSSGSSTGSRLEKKQFKIQMTKNMDMLPNSYEIFYMKNK